MIKLITQPEPVIPDSIADELATEYPLVLPRWNSKKYLNPNDTYDGRWEVWIKLVENTHSLNRFSISKKDLFQDGCIYRKLQTWAFANKFDEDIGFCPLDERFIRSLRLVDTFRNRTFYEDVYEDFLYKKDQQKTKDIRSMAASARDEYYKLDNPIIGRYTKGNWRYQIR